MKGFDNLKIKSARKDTNKFDLSSTHLTTMDFGQIVPLFSMETIPGDKISVKSNYFSRLAPLVKPTYGKFQFKTMTSFVPYYQLADEAEAFIAGKNVWEGSTPDLRWIRMDDLCSWIANYSGAQYTTATDRDAYDYSWIGSNGTQYKIKFEGPSKYAYKVLCALGYALPQNKDEQTGSTWSSQNMGNVKLNAMPLLAFAKAYNDYMSQSQRYNSSQLTSFLKDVKHNKGRVLEYADTTKCILPGGLSIIFNNLKLCYENDYFTSAWQNPNTPLNSWESYGSAIVPGGKGDSVITDTIDNAVNTGVYSSGLSQYVAINQRSLDFLKSFDDWVRRNNYSGSRAVQQIYSRFGIKTDDYRANYAHVITTDSTPVSVGDVVAQASSTSEKLGDYAGKGIMADTKGFSYEASDFGMLFIFGWFSITPMNAYGYDRSVLRMTPLDYYNPEFDGLGAQAISVGEFYTDPAPYSGDTTTDRDVYGFTERYNEYRFGHDRITGEMRGFGASDMNTWHTGRLLTDVRVAGNLVAQSPSVVNLPQAKSEYNRIFSTNQNLDIDHFYLTCQFNVDAVRPMLNLNQVPRLGTGDTNVPRNGNVIN